MDDRDPTQGRQRKRPMSEYLPGSTVAHVRARISQLEPRLTNTGQQANFVPFDCGSQVHHHASPPVVGEPSHAKTSSGGKVLQNVLEAEAHSERQVKSRPDIIDLDDDDENDNEDEDENEEEDDGKDMDEGEEEDQDVYEDEDEDEDDGHWLLKGSTPGGPYVPDIIPSFGGHVAFDIWTGKEHGVLRDYDFTEVLNQWSDQCLPDQSARQIVENSGLQHLHQAMFHSYNMPLLSAFVERWQPDTNTFHMPFGEMTITLHDVWHILRVPIQGNAVVGNPKLTDVLDKVAQLYRYSSRNVVCVIKSGLSDCIGFNPLMIHCGKDDRSCEEQAFGYLLYLLGASLFSEKNEEWLNVLICWPLRDIDKVKNYAWGTAALAWLYRQLGIASRANSFDISGCLTLLQCWIYEYFPIFRPCVVDGYQSSQARVFKWKNTDAYDRDHTLLYEYRFLLDEMTAQDVDWLPYGQKPWDVQQKRSLFYGTINFMDIVEPYMPVRVLRQFGFVQDIPAPPILPLRVNRSAKWESYVSEYSSNPEIWNTPGVGLLDLDIYGKCSYPNPREIAGYLAWYSHRTHKSITHPKNKDRLGRNTKLSIYKRATNILSPWFPAYKGFHYLDQSEEELEYMFSRFDDAFKLMQNIMTQEERKQARTASALRGKSGG